MPTPSFLSLSDSAAQHTSPSESYITDIIFVEAVKLTRCPWAPLVEMPFKLDGHLKFN